MLGVSLACSRSKVAATEAMQQAGSTARTVGTRTWRAHESIRASSQVHAELCRDTNEEGALGLHSPGEIVQLFGVCLWRLEGTTRVQRGSRDGRDR